MAKNSSTATSRDNNQWLGATDAKLVQSVAPRWDWATISESLWSASWPYQLAILEAQKNGKYSQKDIYTLPINPESLTNSMPFASVLQATFGGVVENNGGVPLRSIILTGNLGVINDRESAESLGDSLFNLGGIIGGTIQATQDLLRSATTLGSGEQFTANLYDAAVPIVSSGVPERSTGYYQWLFLQRFLESYAEAKKTENGSKLRLAIYIWKEKAAYLVSPEILQLTRTADKPVEYQYTFKCTAFARVDPNNIISSGALSGSPFNLATAAGATSSLAAALKTIQHARDVIKKFKNLAIAVNADFEKTVGGTLRSIGLLLKEDVGAVKTWADFPDSIKNTAFRIINTEAAIFTNLFTGGPSKVPSSANKLVALTVNTSTIDDEPVEQINNPTPELQTAMTKETDRVLSLTTHDFQNMRQQIEDFNSLFAAKVGTPDPRSTVIVTPIRQATDDDFRLMSAFSESIDAISQVITIQKQQPETSLLDYVAGLSSSAGIEIRRAQSKFAVPFPYGSTLEQLSLQYLGDATRWGEIAALNELRQPYIDEVGLDQSLLSNANGNDIVIFDAEQLQIDHLISISSQTQFPESRRVVALRKLAPGYWSVTLSGPSDLIRFKLSELAKIHYFLPATVNSSKIIFIPSDEPATDLDLQFRYVPTLTDLERILQVGGVDGSLTDSGDIAITQDGNWPYVQGMATLIQWARIVLNTPLRSWVLYPSFGIDIQIGQSIAEISAQDILASIKNSFTLNPSFTGVQSALINIDGPTTQITLELGVKGSDSSLPVTFDLAQ